jgi:Abortive infection alpha
MFSQLLSASMDSGRVSNAHPSFPHIVKQLSADEAKLLNALFLTPKPLRLVQTFRLAGGLSFPGDTEIDELSSTDGLVFPANVAMYRDHMQQLGLLRYSVERAMEPIIAGLVQTGGRNFLEYRLTEFGLKFMRACSATQGKDLTRAVAYTDTP